MITRKVKKRKRIRRKDNLFLEIPSLKFHPEIPEIRVRGQKSVRYTKLQICWSSCSYLRSRRDLNGRECGKIRGLRTEPPWGWVGRRTWIIKGQRSGRNTWKCNLPKGKGGHVRKENMVSGAEVAVTLWWLGGCSDSWESSCSSLMGAEDVLFVPHPG